MHILSYCIFTINVPLDINRSNDGPSEKQGKEAFRSFIYKKVLRITNRRRAKKLIDPIVLI